MANLEELLKRVSEIVVREKTQQEEKRKRGENFNIFKVLGLSTSEVRLHSAFLAELLNPNGDHGLGDNFLKAFVDGVIRKQRESFAFDSASAQVYVEYPVGTVSNNYDKGGRIDILIQDKNRQTIVIENKIYAGDQPLQLYRYNRYLTEDAKLESSQYVLLYLSLEDGDQPSEESTGKNPSFNFYCINYRNDIINWLNECIGKAALFPGIRETISQYVLNLGQILNIMSKEGNQSMINYLIDESNIETTVSILSLSSEIGNNIRKQFIEHRLKEIADKYKLDFSYDQEFILLPYGKQPKYKKIIFKLPQYPKVYFALEQENNEVSYGILNEYGGSVSKRNFEDWFRCSDSWPYGWKYFPNNLMFWDNWETLIDFIKGNKTIDILDFEIRRVLDNHLIEILDEELRNR